jgi:hypothetical protein
MGNVTVASCRPGWADCDGVAANGCEASLESPQSCTSCTIHCAAGQVCNPTGCGATCAPALINCSGSCVDTSIDPNNCGSCGYGPCPPNGPWTFGVCVKGSCPPTYVCPSGFVDTGSQCLDPNWSTQACGSSGHPCPTPTNSWVECDQGACKTICPDGFTDCGKGDCEYLPTSKAACGACGTPCLGTAECVNGQCVNDTTITLLSGLNRPEALAVDGNDIYYTTLGDDSVYHTTITGAAPTLIASAQTRPVNVAVDSGYVYWTSAGAALVLRAPRSGSPTPSVFATATAPGTIVVANGYAYWFDGNQISYMPTAGGTPKALAGSQSMVSGGITIANGTLYASMTAPSAPSDAPFGAAVLPDGPLTRLPNLNSDTACAETGGPWLSYTDGYLYSAGPSYSFATQALGPGLVGYGNGGLAFGATDAAAVGCRVYWIATTSQTPFNATLNMTPNAFHDGPTALLASIGPNVTASFRHVVVTSGFIYWTDAGNPYLATPPGYLYKMAEPP